MAEGGGSAPPPEAVRKGVGRGLFVTVVVVVAIIAFVGGLGVGNLLFKGTTTTARQFFVVGTNLPFPPFENFNTTTGAYEGFDVNITVLIANALGRTLVWQNYASFDVLLTTAGKGGVDMAASSITITANRSKSMSFSDSYYDANQGVLVKSSSTLTCASTGCTVNDLKTKIVAVQSGTTSDAWATSYLIPNGTNVQRFSGVDTELAALTAGSVDLVIIDLPIAKSYAAGSAGTLKVAGEIPTGEHYGFAVAYGDPEGILPVINSVIAQIKANGVYNQLRAMWNV